MTVKEYLHQGIERALDDWHQGFASDEQLIAAFAALARAYIADVGERRQVTSEANPAGA